jgi:hypothetical protein
VFCPNCGTENEEAATPCKKCGFKLRGVSAPKFKGTMLLNSDQAVQQLVQEARRRLEQGSSSDPGHAPLPRSDGQSVAWGNQPAGLRTLNGGLHPPRVTSARVGRTMVGVAPQMGGYTPSSLEADQAQAEPVSDLGEVAPAGSEAPPVSASEIASAEAEPAPKPEGFPALQALRLDGVAANDDPGPRPGGTVNEALAPAPLAAEGSSERATTAGELATAGENVTPHITAPPKRGGSLAPALDLPRRVHPLEIVLVLLTFGLYGFVLWARQRKHATAPKA